MAEDTGYKFVASAALTASKTLVYRMTPTRPSDEPRRTGVERQPVNGGLSVGVHPLDLTGKFFETSISLGTTENADDMRMEEAIVSVSKEKRIVRTSIVGMKGTVKEYVSDDDFVLNITAGLVATENGVVVDKYPEDGVKKLRRLLDHNEALYVSSAFLGMFDISRLVVQDYKIEQDTHSNHQTVTINAVSDEDYIIKSNEY